MALKFNPAVQNDWLEKGRARPREEPAQVSRSLLEFLDKAFKVGTGKGDKPDLGQVLEGETKIINSFPSLIN